jgi:hypothetical protein
MKQLDQATDGTGAEKLLLSWSDLKKHCGLAREDFKTREGWDDMPAQVCEVFRVLAERRPGRPVVAILDELIGQLAPVTEDWQADWRGLASLGPHIYLRAAFNPATLYPLLLPSQPAFLTIEHELRYRQTRNLTRLVDCVNRTRGIKTAAGECASDVSGPLPLWADLGQEAGRLEEAVDRVSRDMEAGVTVLWDSLSPASVERLERMAGEREGWQVRRLVEYTGAEVEQVVTVGPGHVEGISRARGVLGLVTLGDTGVGKKGYKMFQPAYIQAEEEGLLEKLQFD